MTSINQPIRLLLVFGGESSEHAVSIESARNVYQALDPQKYQLYLAYITPGGEWRLVSDIDTIEGEVLKPVLGKRKFTTSAGNELAIDVMFPMLHGRNGEDGTVQGVAKLLHVPCIGPGMIGAAITMDKDITKRLLRDGGVPVVDWLTWHTHDEAPSYQQIMSHLRSNTVFVKPANAGSSVGVSKASTNEQFVAALKEAARHDTIVLIEAAIQAREIEVAVLGTYDPRVSTPGEIIPDADFYSYDDKYAADSRATAHIPAQLEGTLARQLQVYALQAHRLTRGKGMARIDFFVTPANAVYLNEINAIPGFTNISMYPKLWQHDGVSYPQLLDHLVADAIGAHVQ